MYTIGNVQNGQGLADILGCSLGSFPAIYLGLPLGVRTASRLLWEPVVATVRKRLDTWKAKLLSFGGRLTLLKSVLAQLPIYYMSLFQAPVYIVKELERMQNKFFWEGCGAERRPHLVKWEMVKEPKCRGGLGVLDLRKMNLALLGKWSWRFATERNAWWRGKMVEKYGVGVSEWKPVWNLQNAGWSVWRDIVKTNPSFWEYALIDPGGGGVSFWFDSWLPGECLASRFPRIVAAAQSREVLLYDSLVVSDRYSWLIPLTTLLRGGAEEEWQRLMTLLDEVETNWISHGPAAPRWDLNASGGFSVTSFYRALLHQRASGWTEFPTGVIWIPDVPTKVTGFLWQVFYKNISTHENLQKRGFIGPNVCVLCRADLESVSHLFVSCAFTSQVWLIFSSKLAIWGPDHFDIRVLIQGWQSRNFQSGYRRYRDRLIHAIVWFIWLERNNRIFRGKEMSVAAVVWRVADAIGRWLCVASLVSKDELRDWMSLWRSGHDPG
ncbi:Putative ribonuclease H protein At1g65750 [Linum perenne]